MSGLRAQLSPHEEIALRRVALGASEGAPPIHIDATMAAWSALRLPPWLPPARRHRLSRVPVWLQVGRLRPRRGRPAHAAPAQAELLFRPSWPCANPLDPRR
jgi:hypothetical protein